MRHHLIISGTGRTGTTFLVQLFTCLGLDTGFANHGSGIYQNCHAGMEWDLRRPDAPYIVKSPWLCDQLDDILAERQLVIDHAIVPVRDLYAAAESRRDVVRRTDPQAFPAENVPGGLWHTRQPEQQEAVLTDQLYRLVLALARFSIPTTLLFFPRLVTDPQYLFDRLLPILGTVNYQTFHQAFVEVSRPDLVHRFGRGEAQ